MKIDVLVKEAHRCAQDRGFWDDDRTKGECLVSIIAEIGGAVKAFRKDRRANLKAYYENIAAVGIDQAFREHLKDTFEEQLADVCIHLFDFAGAYTHKNANIQTHYDKEVEILRMKMSEAVAQETDRERSEMDRIEEHVGSELDSLQGKTKKPRPGQEITPLAIKNVPAYLFWVTKTVTDIQFNPFPTQSIGESLGKVYYLAQYMGIDIMDLIRIKMAYNRARTK